MGFKDYFIKTTEKYIPAFDFIKEQFKGQTEDDSPYKIKKDEGEEHPYNFKDTIGLYKSFSMAYGAVDKIVDFAVGPGFYVKADDNRAQKIIEDFLKEEEFGIILRSWLRDALVTGNGFMEIANSEGGMPKIKVLSPINMFVKREKDGTIKGYTQVVGGLRGEKIEFTFEEIAHLKHNCIGNEAYGIGIIYPTLDIINKLLKCQKDMQTLLERKANAPYHVKIGSIEKDIVPSQSDITSAANRLSSIKANQEWVTDPYWDIKVVDTGNLSEKFSIPLEHYQNLLFYGFQVPQVLMGAGSIPEGLAKVQMDAFERRIQSIQAEVEKIIEQQIFKRILVSNGFSNVHVEFEWGQPSNEDNRAEIEKITNLLNNPYLRFELKRALEDRIALLMNLEVSEEPEKEKEKELNKPQPQLPGQNAESLNESFFDDTLEEWINNEQFNFKDYLSNIRKYLKSEDSFSQLKAQNEIELTAGKLSTDQIVNLRKVLLNSFKKGFSMNQISKLIKKEVNPQDLFQVKENGEIGDLLVSKESRPIMIARTETIRASNEGALIQFKEDNVERVEWVATISLRTDPDCLELNGKIFEISEARGMIPLHPNCRCSWIPVINERSKTNVREN